MYPNSTFFFSHVTTPPLPSYYYPYYYPYTYPYYYYRQPR